MKNILMCRPDWFNVEYEINPWMKDNKGQVNRADAIAQWDILYNSLKKYANVKLIDPWCGVPDMVFTANAGYYSKKYRSVFVSSFANKERQDEEGLFIQWFHQNGYNVFQPNVEFEGEGDLLRGHGMEWLGHGFRTSRKVKEVYPFNQLSPFRKLELVDSRFYHLDTCFMPLSIENGVLWYPDAFTKKSQDKVRFHIPKRHSIEVTEEEALTFCCNAVVLDKNIFMPNCPSVANKLSKLGYKVHQFDMSEFMKSGGACKCLVMFLD